MADPTNLATLVERRLTRKGQVPICPFPAILDGQPVTVHAVLERTAVWSGSEGGRRVRMLHAFTVDEEAVRWVYTRRRMAQGKNYLPVSPWLQRRGEEERA